MLAARNVASPSLPRSCGSPSGVDGACAGESPIEPRPLPRQRRLGVDRGDDQDAIEVGQAGRRSAVSLTLLTVSSLAATRSAEGSATPISPAPVASHGRPGRDRHGGSCCRSRRKNSDAIRREVRFAIDIRRFHRRNVVEWVTDRSKTRRKATRVGLATLQTRRSSISTSTSVVRAVIDTVPPLIDAVRADRHVEPELIMPTVIVRQSAGGRGRTW